MTLVRMARTIEALVFDLDDTLVVEERSAEAAFLGACELAQRRHGLDPRTLHATLRRTCRELWHASPAHGYCREVGISSWEGLWAELTGTDPNLRTLRNWSPAYRSDSWRAALRLHGVDDDALAGELADAFPRIRRSLNIVYSDVVPILERFRFAHPLGLLTNGAPDLQRWKIEGAHIGPYFTEVVVSGEVGVGKPDPRIFEIMLARLKVAPDRAVMIGNSLRTDIQGAQAIGMKAVWVNREATRNDGAVQPDWEVSSLRDLEKILE